MAAWVSRVDDFVVRNTRDVDLPALVKLLLTSYKRIDRVLLLDMIEIGQPDECWLVRVPPSLRQRLQDLLDDPDG